jgi:hypothetical protein
VGCDTNLNKTRDLDTTSTIETLNKFEFSKVIEFVELENTAYLLQKRTLSIGFSQEMLNKAKMKIKTNERNSKADFNGGLE